MSGKYGSPSFSVLLVDGFSLLGAKPKGFAFKTEALQEATHGLGDTFEETHPTGLSRTTISQNGAFFDDATNGMHQALKSQQQLSRFLCASWTGNVIGQTFLGLYGVYTQLYDVLAAVGALSKADAGYQVDSAPEFGPIVQEWASRNDDWDTSIEGHAVDSGASSANGGAGYLQVSALTGSNPLTCVIRHSDNGVAWSDLVTFTTVNFGPSAQRVTVAGTVKRFLCFKVTGMGNVSASASTSASVSPSVSASASASPSVSPSASRSPSQSTSLSPSSSLSPSASTSLSPSTSISPSVSASASTSFSLSPSVSASASASPSVGVAPFGVTLFAGFSRA